MNRRELLVRTAQVSVGAALAPLLLGASARAAAPAAPASPSAQRPRGRGRIALHPLDYDDDTLVYLKQVGIEDVLVNPNALPGYKDSCETTLEGILAFKARLEKNGLRFAAIVLDQRILARFLMGQPGGDEDLARLCRLIEQMGQAAVPLLMYSLLVSRAILNTSGAALPGYYSNPHGRGGAVIKSFSEERARAVTVQPAGEVSAEVMWDRITRFLERCVPVAEKAQVVLALHPDDPPVARHWGVTQVLQTKAGLERALAIAPSPYHGLLFCQGTIQEAGIDLFDYIRTFGPRGQIVHAEFRGVRGGASNYDETFMDDGDQSLWPVITALRDVGYDGLFEVAHVPKLINDPKRLIVNAWSAAFLKGLLTAADAPR